MLFDRYLNVVFYSDEILSSEEGPLLKNLLRDKGFILRAEVFMPEVPKLPLLHSLNYERDESPKLDLIERV